MACDVAAPEAATSSEGDTEAGSTSNDEGHAGVESDEAAGVVVSQVTYHLDWIWGDAVGLERGGWAVTTDLGYEVEIERAWLTTFSVALVPCPEPRPDDGGATATLGRWLVPVAYAGHSGETDPSAFESIFIEDFTEPEAITLGTVSFAEAEYCRVHLLSAAAREGATGTAPVDAVGTTLWLRGRMRPPGAEAWRELDIETSLANGTFLELPPLQAADGAIDVLVHRRLDTLLDGIELDVAEPSAVEKQVLLDLMHDATLDASAGAP